MGTDDNPIDRRRVLKTIVAGGGIATIAGCTGGNGGGGGSGDGGDSSGGDSGGGGSGDGESQSSASVPITLGGTGGSWGEARAESFYDPFRNGEDPWSSPHELDFSATPSEQYTTSMQRSPDNPPFDLVELDGQRAMLLGERGAVANQAELVENIDNVADAYQNPYMGGTTVFPRGLAYRRDQVSKELTKWDDLIDPELEGRVSIGSWDQAGSKYFFAINQVMGGSLDNLEPGFEWLREFVDVTNPTITTSTDQAMSLWRNGEIYAAPFLSARVDSLRNDEGYDMGFSIPEGGSVMDFWGYPVAENISEEKKQTAVSFLEGAYDPEVQASFSEAFGYPPATPESYDYISEETMEEHPTIQLSEEEIARFDMGIDWLKVEQMKTEVGQQWRSIVRG
jgi:spermidine/putrescine-binding protein